MGVDTVILSANWFNYGLVGRVSAEDIAATISDLHGLGVRVVLVGQSPVFSFQAPQEALFAARRWGRAAEIGTALNSVPEGFNADLKATARADAFLDPAELFCKGMRCRIHNGRSFLFSDYGHVTLEGARIVAGPLLRRPDRLPNDDPPDAALGLATCQSG